MDSQNNLDSYQTKYLTNDTDYTYINNHKDY